MTVRLVSSVEIVRIAKTAGFDAIYVDLEHSAFSIETTCQLSVMALEAGVPALVRVPARTPEYISRVLDGGALGVIDLGADKVESADEVAARIRAALKHLPPERLVVAPDCGMKYLTREAAFGKLKALAEGAALVRSELS